VEQILAWADAHHARTGRWPTSASGPVADAPGERWRNIDGALRYGRRGLPGGGSLARLLDRHRGGMRSFPPTPRGRPWTAGEDELVRDLPPKQAAAQTNRNLLAVYQRRHRLGISPARRWRA
jgi:hypothetical protein